jgi:hypothetical protein
LEETFKDLSFRSESFRPNYFSFLLIKNAFGHYTIDDQRFEERMGVKNIIEAIS